jgi:hypothetical protein
MPKNDDEELKVSYNGWFKVDGITAFESGADVMLEALRKKGEDGHGRSSHYLNDESHRSGVWVFIPDDEVKSQ